ncbi:hypothetical protein Scep_012023 [Stephania cephalantha]|uniref:Uncharacterized protein n=1 Tax=Stephania cephalantha TaxID=152367 RepID=A0AAP0JGD3_9MAGN
MAFNGDLHSKIHWNPSRRRASSKSRLSSRIDRFDDAPPRNGSTSFIASPSPPPPCRRRRPLAGAAAGATAVQQFAQEPPLSTALLPAFRPLAAAVAAVQLLSLPRRSPGRTLLSADPAVRRYCAAAGRSATSRDFASAAAGALSPHLRHRTRRRWPDVPLSSSSPKPPESQRRWPRRAAPLPCAIALELLSSSSPAFSMAVAPPLALEPPPAAISCCRPASLSRSSLSSPLPLSPLPSLSLFFPLFFLTYPKLFFYLSLTFKANVSSRFVQHESRGMHLEAPTRLISNLDTRATRITRRIQCTH